MVMAAWLFEHLPLPTPSAFEQNTRGARVRADLFALSRSLALAGAMLARTDRIKMDPAMESLS